MSTNVDVHVRGLSYSYGKRSALSDVDLRLTSGVTGLLGPNGAGKSTLMNVIASLARPATGQVRVGSLDLAGAKERSAARKLIGYLPQRFSVVGGMSVQRHVEYAAWTHGVDNTKCEAAAQKALHVVDLGDLATRRARTLSGGQRQRLGIACAIAHEPAVLLLDEPTVGLDPLQRVQIREHLDRIADSAVVLISTHLVDDVAQIADGLLVMLNGRIVFEGAVASLAAPPGTYGSHLSPLEAGYNNLVRTAGMVEV